MKKILLLQMRKEEVMANHELECVKKHGKLSQEIEIFQHNIVLDGEITEDMIAAYDAVVVGGSGEFSVLDEIPENDNLMRAIQYIYKEGIPFMGLCYGFQMAVKALGGEVISDYESKEMGAHIMFLTKDAGKDPLLAGLPESFEAACGRKDRALRLPEGAFCGIKSGKIPYHHLKMEGKPFWGTQFHPELSAREDNLYRLDYYKDAYHLSDEEYARQKEQYKDAPLTALLLERFFGIV